MEPQDLDGKKKRLEEILSRMGALVVAFSGGVDSTYLLAVARKVLGGRVTAVTAESPLHPQRERREAVALARRLSVRHVLAASREMAIPEFVANTRDRCYVCKKDVLGEVFRIAAELGVREVAHGVNVDDLGDYRPGLKAAEEMGVRAPLLEAGLTKAEIRALSRRMRLPTWNKPSMACLASRIPYGTPITTESLKTVEAAEELLHDAGFKAFRVRLHGPVARIEVDRRGLKKLMTEPLRADIVQRMRSLGFQHVAVDLEGYVQGSLNRSLELGRRNSEGGVGRRKVEFGVGIRKAE
jgi:uncharacterized protein